MAIRWHDEDPALLGEAIRFTASETGFIDRLIEKDYFCSVLLEYLAGTTDAPAFKGGTCLSKIYSGFYRLSEDLDFSISTPADSTRANRSASVVAIRQALEALRTRLPVFHLQEPLTGANQSTHYSAVVAYSSLLGENPETIRVEVGLREPILIAPPLGSSRTAVQNPMTGLPLVDVHQVRCMSYPELMAEKLRAALCRRDVAIRDFFDVDHAVQNSTLDVADLALIDLLRKKLAVPGTEMVDVSADRLAQLRRQVDGQLRPVLRDQEFASFDLNRAIETVSVVARLVADHR